MKKLITAVLASFVLFTGTAFATSASDIFTNYGGDIQQGDMMVTVSTSMPWSMFNAINNNGWAAPSILAEFEYAQPIAVVPFTFGGYVGMDFRGYPGAYYYNDGNYYYYDQYGNRYVGNYIDVNKMYNHFILTAGGLASYHICVPVDGLDIFASLKMGINMDISNLYPNNVRFDFDWGLNVGASYFFTDNIGVKASLGYPCTSIGAIFKL